MTSPASQNSAEAAGNHPPPGKPFEPGKSGNPGGRPKGLARKVREVLGEDDGEALARFWAGVLSGEILTITQDANGNRVEERTKVSVKDRIDVSKLLAERGWGKPPQYAPIEDDDPLDLSIRQQNDIAADLDARVDELARQRAKRLEDAEAARVAAGETPPA